MPRVEAYLYAMLRRYQPSLPHGQPAILELPAGSTINELLVALGVPDEEIKQTFVNGISRNLDWVLGDGDRVAVFPPIAGGEY